MTRKTEAVAAVDAGPQIPMGFASSCWGGRGVPLCADAFGLSEVPRVTIRRGGTIAIRHLGDAVPVTASAHIAPWPTPERFRPLALPAAKPTTLRIDEPPGDHLVSVSTSWRIEHPYDPEGGEVTHLIRVRVTGHLPPSGRTARELSLSVPSPRIPAGHDEDAFGSPTVVG